MAVEEGPIVELEQLQPGTIIRRDRHYWVTISRSYRYRRLTLMQRCTPDGDPIACYDAVRAEVLNDGARYEVVYAPQAVRWRGGLRDDGSFSVTALRRRMSALRRYLQLKSNAVARFGEEPTSPTCATAHIYPGDEHVITFWSNSNPETANLLHREIRALTTDVIELETEDMDELPQVDVPDLTENLSA